VKSEVRENLDVKKNGHVRLVVGQVLTGFFTSLTV
jgi:hypothetical protein